MDLPAIDCVCFTDTKRSKVDIVQAAGRALRLSKGKKFGYILIPIFIPDGMDFNTAAEQQGFDEVSTTVRALATTDKRIVEYLRVISEGGTPPVGGNPIDGIISVYNLTNVEAEEFNKAIQLKIWDKVAFVNRRPFEEARAYVKKLNLKSAIEWELFAQNKHKVHKKKPLDIPSRPNQTYKNKWKGYGHWLGTGRGAAGNWRPFENARDFARKLKLKNAIEWQKFCKNKNKPFDIPVTPDRIYKNKWMGYGDWLGTGNVYLVGANKKWRPFKKACEFVKKLNIKSQREWKLYSQNKLKMKPIDIPTNPHVAYKNQWRGYDYWIGSGKIGPGNMRSFKKARAYVQKLNLKGYKEWNLYCKNELKGFKEKPQDIPASPKSYKDEWKGFGDWLGTGVIANKNKIYRPFKEARAYVQKLN